MTGETVAKKFFNGTNSMNVDKNLKTMASRGSAMNAFGGTPQPTKNLGKSGSNARYNSSNKADALSRALSDVISEKQSIANFSSKRGSSTVCSRSYVAQHPLMSSTLNAKTFRDVDSQADRYRNTIRTM